MRPSLRTVAVCALCLALSVVLAGLGCVVSDALAPLVGVPQYTEAGLVSVPGGFVQAAGGNLILRREDLSLDTPLGRLVVSASYDSVAGSWRWNHQMHYAAGVFTDATGAVFDLAALPDGAPVPGSVWTKVDAATIATRGGLAHHFDASGALDRTQWRTLDYPRLEYDAGSIRQCTSPAVCSLLFAIAAGPSGQPASITDARSGRETRYSYDAAGRLVRVEDPLAIENGWPGTRYEYQGAGTLLSAVINSEGERIEYTYQVGRRIRSVVQIGEGDPVHRFEFGGVNALSLYPTLHTNPLGGQTRYHFDAQRRLRRIERLGAGETELVEWSGLRPSQTTDAAGVTTRYTWSGDALATRTDPSGNVVSFTYEPGALNRDDPLRPARRRLDDSIGPVEERSYDASGRLTGLANGSGDWVSVGYDAGSNVATITDPAGLGHAFPVYGLHGHWLEREGAAADRRVFDAVGDPIVASVVGERGGLLTRGYDANRGLATLELAATDELGSVVGTGMVAVTRRSDGRITSIARPGGGDHELVYDALGRLVERRERIDGQWQATRFEYDLAGNPTARTRPNGMREELDFDAHGRIVARRALRNGVLEGTLTLVRAQGRLVAANDDVRGSLELYGYDEAGRLETTLYSYTESLVREYDLRSRLTRETFQMPGSGVIADIGYDYDAADRPTRIRDRLTGEDLVTRDFANGRLAETRYGNGLTRAVQYDAASGRLAGFLTTDPGGAVIESTALLYTSEVNPPRRQIRNQMSTALAVTVEEYWLKLGGSLASADELAGPRVFGWNDGGGLSRAYAYDELGNRVSDASGNTFVYNAERNRLLSAALSGGPTLDYTYDEAGFVTSRGGVPLGWTATGRLASHGADTLAWDLSGRLVSMEVGGVGIDFTHFGGRVPSDPATGALGGLDLGEVVLQLGSGARRYRHLDFRGNVSFVSDEAGAVLEQHQYAAYGPVASEGGSTDGHSWDGNAEFGALVLAALRVYDPAVGRFLSPDPILSLSNQFVYTSGNPIDYLDLEGLFQAPRTVVTGLYLTSAIALSIGLSPVLAPITIGGITLGALATYIGISSLVSAAAFDFIGALSQIPDARPANGGSSGPDVGAQGKHIVLTIDFSQPSSDSTAQPAPGSISPGGCAPTALAAPTISPKVFLLLVAVQVGLAAVLLHRRLAANSGDLRLDNPTRRTRS